MILLIGYGNPLRGDDGVGYVLAERLAERFNRDDLRVALLHQLTPEVVADIAGATHVIFIDAREGSNSGTVICEVVQPQHSGAIFTHQATPGALLGLAQDWYGAAPEGLLISVVGAAFDYDDKLSPGLQARLPAILDEVEQLIRSHVFKEV
jgi:hydrogenase maturation protease